MNIKLTEAQKIKIINSNDVFAIMQKILLRENKIDQDKEHFWIVGLSSINKVLFIELVCLGSVNEAVVEPINVFRVAILKNAVSVILVHNHPSDEVKPKESAARMLLSSHASAWELEKSSGFHAPAWEPTHIRAADSLPLDV